MKTTDQIRIIGSAFLTAVLALTASAAYELKYDSPAKIWEEALPLGSGSVGAMVWGGVQHETVDLNEDTVWSGSPNSNVNPDIRGRLGDIRKAILEGRLDDAKPDSFPGARNHGMNYQFPGSLKLDFDGVGEKIDGYLRTLSLDDAFARVGFAADGVRHDRAAFAPLGKGGFVYRLKAEKKGALAFRASLKRAHESATVSVEDGTLVLRGVTSDKDGVPGKVRYTVLVKVAECDGKVAPEGDAIRVSGASKATVYVAIGTNFKRYDDISGDADAVARKRLAELTAGNAKSLFAAHCKVYREQADRCTLDLGTDKFPQKMTDRRLADFASSDDPYFAALYFRYGRYLLISCSQPGSQPANLQGLWNNSLTPPWCSKYTVNINTEMNYWPSEVTNLGELSNPLFKMIGELSVTGAKAAEEMYGAKGWVTHHNTDRHLDCLRMVALRRRLAFDSPLGALPVHARQEVPGGELRSPQGRSGVLRHLRRGEPADGAPRVHSVQLPGEHALPAPARTRPVLHDGPRDCARRVECRHRCGANPRTRRRLRSSPFRAREDARAVPCRQLGSASGVGQGR